MTDSHTKPTFLPGLRLCGQFYQQAVRPILDLHFPKLPHAAALLGDGSEVLGFDDPLSTDHHWGPRILLFLNETQFHQVSSEIEETLSNELPYQFAGYSTNFTLPDPDDNGVQSPQSIEAGPINHRVSVLTIRQFIDEQLCLDIERDFDIVDWLTFSEQRLLSVTAGEVYHDEVGLIEVQQRFSYYPRAIWLYLLAAGWSRIGEEEHLMGRAGLVGDEVGSALIGGRLVRDIMRLCFLMERTYAPYQKWFGTAFKRLSCAKDLGATLRNALQAETWRARESYLIQALEYVAAKHNALGLTKPMPEQAVSFHGRPFKVVAFHGFAEALVEQIEEPVVREIATRSLIGNLDQISDNTNLVSDPRWRPALKHLYTTTSVQ